MKTTERTASPALGNAVGYFVVLWAVSNVDWITVDNQVEAVAFAGAIFTYFFNEIRQLFLWGLTISRARGKK
jgi:hypothetical protein